VHLVGCTSEIYFIFNYIVPAAQLINAPTYVGCLFPEINFLFKLLRNKVPNSIKVVLLNLSMLRSLLLS